MLNATLPRSKGRSPSSHTVQADKPRLPRSNFLENLRLDGTVFAISAKLQVDDKQYIASGGFSSVINMMFSREQVASLSEIGHSSFCARWQMYSTTNRYLSAHSPLAAACIVRWIVSVISLPILACVLWKSAACFRSVSWPSLRFLT